MWFNTKPPSQPSGHKDAQTTIDPSVQHVGISRLRALNVTQLREQDKTLVIQDNDKPLAVLLKYEQFVAMQEMIRSND